MLTPRFKVDQDDKFVVVSIYAPFTHVSETEIFMDGCDFRFFSKPYFLRLHFPGEIVENDHASAKFDADTLSYVVKCPKVNHGELFANLDMVTELCKPRGSSNVSQIEELDGVQTEDEEEEDWYFDQKVPSVTDIEETLDQLYPIGFGLKHRDVFTKLLEECQEVIDIKCPDKIAFSKRTELRIEKELKDFDPDHYLSDLYEPDDTLTEIVAFDVKAIEGRKDADLSAKLVGFSRKDTKIEPKHRLSTLCGLIDIIFGFCYDQRVNLGEVNSESGWTIAKLSSTLVCSDNFKTLLEAVLASSRRSLIYPLYRNFSLTQKVWEDVLAAIRQGRSNIVRILLTIAEIFNESEGRYIFNQLYIDQYIPWIQSVKEESLARVVCELEGTIASLKKRDLGLELIELEEAAEMVQKEESESLLVNEMSSIAISSRSAKEDDSDDDSSSTSDDSSSTSDDSSSSNDDG